MVRVCVLACLAAALACKGVAAGTIEPIKDAAEYNLRSVNQTEVIEQVGPAVLYGHSLLPTLDPDDPLKLLSDLKLDGEIVLSLPVDLSSDKPWMAGLSPRETSTTFNTTAAPETFDSKSMAAAQLAAMALGGAGLLCLSLVLWRRSARRARRRSVRRRNGSLQTA